MVTYCVAIERDSLVKRDVIFDEAFCIRQEALLSRLSCELNNERHATLQTDISSMFTLNYTP
jgi:hypothetical protein